jgi:Ras-related protein Rab-6A
VAAILVFDVTDRTSFQEIDEWSEAFFASAGSDTDIVLVGNKLDLAEERVIGQAEAAEAARDRSFMFVEASAKDGTNVVRILELLTEAILKRHGAAIAADETHPASQEKSCC